MNQKYQNNEFFKKAKKHYKTIAHNLKFVRLYFFQNFQKNNYQISGDLWPILVTHIGEIPNPRAIEWC